MNPDSRPPLALELRREGELSSARMPAHPAGYLEAPPEARSEDDLRVASLRDYLHALARRKWLILALGTLGLFLGLACILPRPLPYPARTSIEVQGFNESFMKMNEVDPQASQGIYAASTANILTQVRILNSQTLRRRVLEKLERETIASLPPHGTGVAALVNGIRSALGLSPREPTRALREALRAASASAAAQAVEGTRVVEIACQSPHPELAAEFLNTLVNEFIDQGIESRAKSAQRTSQWLSNQLEEQKTKLEEAEANLREFVGRAGVAGLTQEDNKNTLAQSKALQLQQELAAIQADRIAKQSRYEMALARGVESLAELVQGSSLPSLQGTLAGLQREKAQLLASLTPAHYKVQRVQAEINETETAIQKEKAQILQRVRSECETALQREKLLAGAYSGQSGVLLSQSHKALQYTLLRREVDSNRQLYNLMVQQVNQAGIASAVPTNNIRMIDSASPAFEPSYRHVYVGGGLGCVTGLLFGCVLAVVLQQLDRRLRTPGQVFGGLHLPELGVIPSELAVEKRPMLRLRVGRWGVHFSRGAAADNGDHDGAGEHRVELVTYHHKPSPIAESFRATLMSILFSLEGQKNSVWGVTSPNPKEGKSTVTSNLAIALAELRRRVLVIDCDLRKPRLHEIFDVPNTWGLTDLLQESTPMDQYPGDSLFRPTTIQNLYVLPSGPAVSGVNTLLCSERMKQLIERLRKDIDTVLIDTPPMMILPDARIIGQAVDAVILVLRSGFTSLEDARAASTRLASDGTRILGTVLNDWRPAGVGGGYRRYYSYYRSYYATHQEV